MKSKEMCWLEAEKQNIPPPQKKTHQKNKKIKTNKKHNGFNNFKITHRSV